MPSHPLSVPTEVGGVCCGQTGATRELQDPSGSCCEGGAQDRGCGHMKGRRQQHGRLQVRAPQAGLRPGGHRLQEASLAAGIRCLPLGVHLVTCLPLR